MAAPTDSFEFNTLAERALGTDDQILIGDKATSNLGRLTSTTELARIPDGSNIINVYENADLPDARTAFFINVQDNGVGDTRFITTGAHEYIDEQNIEISNSTVPTYDGFDAITINDNVSQHTVVDSIAVGIDPFGIAVNDITGFFYVVDAGGADVQKFSTKTNLLINSLNVGFDPYGIVIDTTTNRYYVTQTLTNMVAVINASNDSGLANIGGFGIGPKGIALNVATRKGYTANSTGPNDNVSVFDLDTNTLLKNITLPEVSGSIAVAVDEILNKIYVSNEGTFRVSVLDGNNDNGTFVTNIIVGNGPLGIAVNKLTSRVYVVNATDGTLSIIDGKNNVVVDTITVGTNSRYVAVNEDLNLIYVTILTDGKIVVIDGLTNKIIDVITEVSVQPEFIAIDPTTGIIYSTHDFSGEISIINAQPLTIPDSVISSITSPFSIISNPITNFVYVLNQQVGTDEVSVINGRTNVIDTTIPVGNGGHGINVHKRKNLIYVANKDDGTLSVINGEDNTVVDTITLGGVPLEIGVNFVTDKVYVTNVTASSVSVIDANTNDVITTITGVTGGVEGIAVDHLNNEIYVVIGNGVRIIDGSNDTLEIITISVTGPAREIAVNTKTRMFYVLSFNPTNIVSVIDGDTVSVVTTISVGDDPMGITVDEATNTIYVANSNDDTVSVIDGDTNTVVGTTKVGNSPLGIDVNNSTGVVRTANIGDNTISVVNPHAFDIPALAFTANAKGDIARSLNPNIAYFLHAPIVTEFGYKKVPNTVLAIHSLNRAINFILLTGQNTTFLDDEAMIGTDLFNLRVIDGSGVFPATTNRLFNATGFGVTTPLVMRQCQFFFFNDLGVVNNLFWDWDSGSAVIQYSKGFELNECDIAHERCLVRNDEDDVTFMDINNIDPESPSKIMSLVSVVANITKGSMFNINPATLLKHTITLINGNKSLGGNYFKPGSEVTGGITSFQDAGGGDVVVTVVNSLVSGQTVRITNSINYNDDFVVVFASGTAFTFTHTFDGNDGEANYQQVRKITAYAADNLSTRLINIFVDDSPNGTIVQTSSPIETELVNGMTVLIFTNPATDYSGLHKVSNINRGSQEFNIDVPFSGENPSQLEYTVQRTSITIPNHDLPIGTLPILVDETIDYDGGEEADIIDANTIRLNFKPFITNETTGVVLDGSLNQDALNMTISVVEDVKSSAPLGSTFMSGNAVQTIINNQNEWVDLVLGDSGNSSNPRVEESPNNTKHRLINPINGELEHRDLKFIEGNTRISVSAFSSGGSQKFEFRIVKNGGVLPKEPITILEIGSSVLATSLDVDIDSARGDRLKSQVRNIDGTSNITAVVYSMMRTRKG